MRSRVGFLDEAEGVRSSTRLFGLILLILSAIVVVTIAVYTIYTVHRGLAPSPGVITALVAGLTPLVVQGVIAIVKRGGGDVDVPAEPEHTE